jgi:hypothetical protein
VTKKRIDDNREYGYIFLLIASGRKTLFSLRSEHGNKIKAQTLYEKIERLRDLGLISIKSRKYFIYYAGCVDFVRNYTLPKYEIPRRTKKIHNKYSSAEECNLQESFMFMWEGGDRIVEKLFKLYLDRVCKFYEPYLKNPERYIEDYPTIRMIFESFYEGIGEWAVTIEESERADYENFKKFLRSSKGRSLNMFLTQVKKSYVEEDKIILKGELFIAMNDYLIKLNNRVNRKN